MTDTPDTPDAPAPLHPLSDAEWPEELAHLKAAFLGTANVYRVMAHHPALLASWAGFRDHVVTRNALGTERLEVAILRLAHRLDARYEWTHHILRGRKAGLSDGRILSLREPPEAMKPEDAVIARSVDALVDRARLPRDVHRDLHALVGKEGVLDLMATVGMYSTLAFILNSFDTPTDPAVEAELERNPLA